MGPVRVNRRGMSIGGGVGVGPVGFGYGKRIAKFGGTSGRSTVENFAMIFVIPLVLIIPFVYLAVQFDKFLVLPVQLKLKPQFAKYRVTKTILLLMTLFGGFLGIHQYALGRIRLGLMYTMTLGCFGLFCVRDIYLIINNKLLDVNARPILEDKVSNFCKQTWHGQYLGQLQSWRKWIGFVSLPGAAISIFSPSTNVSRGQAIFSVFVILLLILNPKIYGIKKN